MLARSRWVVVAVAVVCLALVAVVARSHPSHPFTKLPAPSQASIVDERTLPSLPNVHGSQHVSPVTASPAHSTDLRWLASLLLALLAAGAVLALGRFTRGRWGFSFGKGGRHTGNPVPAPGVQMSAPLELTDAVTQGMDEIAHGPVSDAIIACWVRVEDAAGNAGVQARRSETSTEFVDRVLGSFGARETTLRRMSALYREARFSEHVMDESSRDEARACLRAIRDDLEGARETT